MRIRTVHRLRAALLAGAGSFLIAGPTLAAQVTFAQDTGVRLDTGTLSKGRSVVTSGGLVQVRLASGALVSFTGPSEFQALDGDALRIARGAVTVVQPPGGDAVDLRLADDTRLDVAGSASLTVGADGVTGRVITGEARARSAAGARSFGANQALQVRPGQAPRLVIAAGPQATPRPISGGVAISGYNAVLDGAVRQNPALATLPMGDDAEIAAYLIALGETISQMFTPEQLLALVELYGPGGEPPVVEPPTEEPPVEEPPAPPPTQPPTQPPTDPPPSTGPAVERPNQIAIYAGDKIGIDTQDDAALLVAADGRIDGYAWQSNRASESPERGTNAAFEIGGVGEIIAWSRWAGGTTAGSYFGNPPVTRTEQQGFHIVGGAPATNVPTSGTFTYALVGATKPTLGSGAVEPGSFDGQVGVSFGSTSRVGLDLHVTIGGFTYDILTPGGAADPGASPLTIASNGTFRAVRDTLISVNPGGPACGGSSCKAAVNGFLAGPGASHLGLAYTISETGLFDSAGRQVFGVAAFGK